MSEEVEAVSAVVADAIGRSTDWASLAASGLLSLVVPTDHGGEGLGLAELAVVLRAVGQHAVQLPVWETLCVGALTLAAAGSDDQQKSLLPGIANGDVVLAAALREVGAGFPTMPATVVIGDRVTGRKIAVQYADRAAALVVSGVSDGRPVVGLVDPRAHGVTLIESASSRALLDGVSSTRSSSTTLRSTCCPGRTPSGSRTTTRSPGSSCSLLGSLPVPAT